MLSPKLLEILRAWWRTEKPKDWLFQGDFPGQHITRGAVNREGKKAHRICKIPKPITPHSLRHAFAAFAVHALAFAVHLLEQGTDVISGGAWLITPVVALCVAILHGSEERFGLLPTFC